MVKKTIILFLVLIAVISLALSFLISPVRGTETLITLDTAGSNQDSPAISGDWIVWADTRNGHSDIYAYDLATGIERRLTQSDGDAYNPAISGNRVVWQEYQNGNDDIWLYDLGTGTKEQITTDTAEQINPSIDGDLIAWQDYRGGSADVYAYNIGTHTESLLTPGTPDSDQTAPVVSGSLVAWQDYRFYNDMYLGNFYDILMNDTATGKTYNLTTGTEDSDQQYPAISGGRVVWQDSRNAQFGDIYMNDTSTWSMSRVNDAGISSSKILPAISGSTVIWLDNRDRGGGGDFDIYRKNLLSGSDTRVTDSFASVISGHGAKISGNRIVWTDYRNGDNDIYLDSIDSTLSCPAADFSISPAQSGPVPLAIQFEDKTASGAGILAVSHWNWSFGDGNSSTAEDPAHTFAIPGTYVVRLTVDNPYCRNETPVQDSFRVSAGSSPVASFSAAPLSGMVPLEVTVSDTSIGATAWNWSFGDGSYSDQQNPPHHTYPAGGTYTIELNASNDYGFSLAHATVHALTGAEEAAVTTIPGITVTTRNGRQFLTFDGITLTGYTFLSPSVLVSPALPAYGWQNITFVTDDPAGFADDGHGTITGNLTRVLFFVRDIHPAGFSAETGPLSSVNFSTILSSYPANGVVDTRVWEGYLPEDLSAFSAIASGSGFSYIYGIAYTTKITRTGFPAGGSSRIYMSVNSSWVAGHGGRDHTYIMRISDDRSAGEVLRTSFLYNDAMTDLDYFEADSPRGLSTFGLVQLAGTGNLFQMIDLSVTQRGGEGSSDSGLPATTVVTTLPVPATSPTPPQPAMETPSPPLTASIYSNAQGVITQATLLRSADGQASITLGTGIIAMDAEGRPLSSVSISPAASSEIGVSSTGGTFQYTGHGYDLGPEGATFSPAIGITFTVPELGWNSQYIVREYDKGTQTWIDLPTMVHADTGTISANVSHFCCVALFAQSVQGTIPHQAPVRAGPTVMAAATSSPPSHTAIDVFLTFPVVILTLLRENILLIGCIVLVIAAVWFMGRKKRMDRIRYG